MNFTRIRVIKDSFYDHSMYQLDFKKNSSNTLVISIAKRVESLFFTSDTKKKCKVFVQIVLIYFQEKNLNLNFLANFKAL